MQSRARTDNRKIHGHAVELAHRLEMLVKLQRFEVPRQRALENSQDQLVVRFESVSWACRYFNLVALVKTSPSRALLLADDDRELIVIAIVADGGRKQGRQFQKFFEIVL